MSSAALGTVATTLGGDTPGQLQSSAANDVFVSPIVTEMTPDGFINISGEVVTSVTVTGIHRAFDVSFNELADIAALLNGFELSTANGGTYLDARLGQNNYNYSSVSMRVAATTAFKAAIWKALNTATDGSGEVVDQYLSRQLHHAFVTAFPALASMADLAQGAVAGAAVTGTVSAAAAGAINFTGITGVDEDVQSATTSLTSTNNLHSFRVDVITDISEGANDLWTAHDGALARSRNALLTQLPRANLVSYMDSSGAGAIEGKYAYIPLETTALPLVDGNTLAFIFDIDVDTANNAQSTNPPGEGSESVGGQMAGDSAPNQSAFGSDSFSLNMANRRVALRIKCQQSSSPTGAAFTVGGAGLFQKPSQATPIATPYNGSGLNPA